MFAEAFLVYRSFFFSPTLYCNIYLPWRCGGVESSCAVMQFAIFKFIYPKSYVLEGKATFMRRIPITAYVTAVVFIKKYISIFLLLGASMCQCLFFKNHINVELLPDIWINIFLLTIVADSSLLDLLHLNMSKFLIHLSCVTNTGMGQAKWALRTIHTVHKDSALTVTVKL